MGNLHHVPVGLIACGCTTIPRLYLAYGAIRSCDYCNTLFCTDVYSGVFCCVISLRHRAVSGDRPQKITVSVGFCHLISRNLFRLRRRCCFRFRSRRCFWFRRRCCFRFRSRRCFRFRSRRYLRFRSRRYLRFRSRRYFQFWRRCYR